MDCFISPLPLISGRLCLRSSAQLACFTTGLFETFIDDIEHRI
jgi:hypothetical protein